MPITDAMSSANVNDQSVNITVDHNTLSIHAIIDSQHGNPDHSAIVQCIDRIIAQLTIYRDRH